MILENKDRPAFASSSPSCNKYDGHLQEGLTKREYFAGLAMQAFCSIPNTGITVNGFAERSVQMADALLKELNK